MAEDSPETDGGIDGSELTEFLKDNFGKTTDGSKPEYRPPDVFSTFKDPFDKFAAAPKSFGLVIKDEDGKLRQVKEAPHEKSLKERTPVSLEVPDDIRQEFKRHKNALAILDRMGISHDQIGKKTLEEISNSASLEDLKTYLVESQNELKKLDKEFKENLSDENKRRLYVANVAREAFDLFPPDRNEVPIYKIEEFGEMRYTAFDKPGSVKVRNVTRDEITPDKINPLATHQESLGEIIKPLKKIIEVKKRLDEGVDLGELADNPLSLDADLTEVWAYLQTEQTEWFPLENSKTGGGQQALDAVNYAQFDGLTDRINEVMTKLGNHTSLGDESDFFDPFDGGVDPETARLNALLVGYDPTARID